MSKDKEEKFVSIRENWKDVDLDLVQRMRFMNADAEIPPEDSYTEGTKKFKEDD